jgi:hypothetical protein
LALSGASKSEVYESLVGLDLKGQPGGDASSGGLCSTGRRVVPGNPDMSVLYQKITDKPTCGVAMPPPPRNEAAMVLTAAQQERIRSWIMAGAKKN